MSEKFYPVTLDELALFADMACQLDHVKNCLPKDSLVAEECADLMMHGHAAVQRLLGADVDKGYAPEPEGVAA